MLDAHADLEYLALAKRILEEGNVQQDRTGTGTLSVFGGQMRFDLSKGFPLLTTKKLPFRVIAEELFWFLSGSTNVRDLLDKDVHIWDDDAYRWHRTQNPDSTMSKERFLEVVQQGDYDYLGLGELGPLYGAQWVNWGGSRNNEGINQIKNVILSIKSDPHSRRHLVTAWNPSVLGEVALPSCHVLFQFYVHNGKLSCQFYMRSNDFFLGTPFNIASYALLTHLIAKMTGLEVGELIFTGGDIHLYLNHLDQIKLQMTREPRPLPKLEVLTVHDRIEDYTMADLKLTGYDPHGPIKGKVSVGN